MATRHDDESENTRRVLQRAGQGIYLGDPTAVAKLVGEFAYAVLDHPKEIAKDIDKMARIFAGKEAGFATVGAWNDGCGFDEEAGIVTSLKAGIKGLTGDDPEAVLKKTFGVLAVELLREFIKCRSEGTLDSEWISISKGLVNQFVNMLTGLPCEG